MLLNIRLNQTDDIKYIEFSRKYFISPISTGGFTPLFMPILDGKLPIPKKNQVTK